VQKNLLTLIILLTFIFLNENVQPQSAGKLRGLVTDSTNGEALAFCNVYIDELKTGASTNERGYFVLNSLPLNKDITLLVSFVGYTSKKINITLSSSQLKDILIQLSPSSVQLQAIEKIGEKIIEKNSTDIGLERISIKQIENLPKGVETDVMRSLQ